MQSTYASQNEEAKHLIEIKDWPSAFLAFTKLITLEGITSAEKSIAYSNRSYVLYNMSKFANAKTDALKSIDSNPSDTEFQTTFHNCTICGMTTLHPLSCITTLQLRCRALKVGPQELLLCSKSRPIHGLLRVLPVFFNRL